MASPQLQLPPSRAESPQSPQERLRRARHRVRKAKLRVETCECVVEDLFTASRPLADILEAEEGVKQAEEALKACQQELDNLEAKLPHAAAASVATAAPVTQSFQNCTFTGSTISGVAQSPSPPVVHQDSAQVDAAVDATSAPQDQSWTAESRRQFLQFSESLPNRHRMNEGTAKRYR